MAADGQRLSLKAKQEFVRLNQEEQKALDEAETEVIERFARLKFVAVAAVPEEHRDAQQREYYDQWSFKFKDDGSPAPTIIVPTQAELAAIDTREIKNRSAVAGHRAGRTPGQRLRG